MIQAAKNATGEDIAYEVADRRAGDPAVLIASNQKAKDILGWSPKFTAVEDIIKSAWKFHKKFPEGFKE